MLKFGFVGIGQCGGKIADAFARQKDKQGKSAYSVLAINTSEKDLNGLTYIALENRVKIIPDGSKGGAGKDPSVGAQAMQEHYDDILRRVRSLFSDTDFLFLCAGMGGGTGSGATPVLVEKLLGSYRLCLVLTMPDASEGVEVKGNAIEAIVSLLKTASENDIPVLVIENEKIIKKMKSLPGFDWRTANEIISRTLHHFNISANDSSQFSTFDEADYAKVLSRPGVFTVSKTFIPVTDIQSDTVIKDRVLESWKNELLSIDSDFTSAQMCSVIVQAPSSFLSDRGKYKLLEMSLDELKKSLGTVSRYTGIYADDHKPGRVTVYCLVSGMSAPLEKLKQLYSSAQEESFKMAQKIQATADSFDLSAFGGVGNVFAKPAVKKPKTDTFLAKIIGGKDNETQF